MKKFMRKRGFTLIELLVVIAIIGILAALILISLRGAQDRARDTQRKTNARSLDTALAQYYLDKSLYSFSSTVTDAAGGMSLGTATACTAPLQDHLITTGGYLNSATACGDPAATPLAHLYRTNATGSEYAIGWQLAYQGEGVTASGNGVYQTAADGALTVPNTADFSAASAFPDAVTKVFVVYGPQ